MKKRFLIGIMTAALLMGCGSVKETVESDEAPLSEEVVEEAEEIEDIEGIYPDGRAMMQPATAYDAIEGYCEYIKNNELYGDNIVFKLAYINEDDVPDVIFGSTEGVHASNIYILTYPFGESTVDGIVMSGPFGCYNMTSYIPHYNIICTEEPGGMNVTGSYYSCLNAFGEAERIGYEESYWDDDYEEELETHYYLGVDNKEVSKEEYISQIKELTGDNEFELFNTYENEEGYHVLSQESLDENLYAEEFFEAQK